MAEGHLGAIAQLEERLVCIQKARGSSPLSSTGQRTTETIYRHELRPVITIGGCP